MHDDEVEMLWTELMMSYLQVMLTNHEPNAHIL